MVPKLMTVLCLQAAGFHRDREKDPNVVELARGSTSPHVHLLNQITSLTNTDS